MTSQLEDRLRSLADRIEVPREEGTGTPATLRALMPCEPAMGEVAVACWVDSEDGELVELVELESGRRIADPAALREALALLAMVETVEELASFDALGELRNALAAWPIDAGTDAGTRFDMARERALHSIDALAALDPGEAPRMARTSILDALGGALRELERAWEHLEQAAEGWSDAHLDAAGRSAEAVEHVQALWRILAQARRGPLRSSAGAALQAGREAGVAMAAAVTQPG